MRKSAVKAFPIVIGLALIVSAVSLTENLADRQKKHFSLFSVVTFKNEECTSELTGGSGTARAGTCHTSTECSDMNGMKSGNCAAGFGVCCVSLSSTGASATINVNRTYLRNSEYSAIQSAATAVDISYTINKMSSDICQLRLDFVDFVIGGPANTQEIVLALAGASQTHCNADFMTITSAGSGAEMPTICGMLTGEHLYVDIGSASTDSSVIRISTAITGTLSPTTAGRIWDIKTSQIECYSNYRAPEGCHRYMTDDVGKIISLNFRRSGTTVPTLQAAAAGQNTGLELASQNIRTCIRRSKGMCCVEFQVCAQYNGINLVETVEGAAAANNGLRATFAEGWSIDMDTRDSAMLLDATQTNLGLVDSFCYGDYVEIPSSWSGACGAGHSSARSMQNTRYCGHRFGASFAAGLAASTSTPVCDCSEPFSVTMKSDQFNDAQDVIDADGTGNIGLLVVPRGVCLDYTQKPCYF